MNELIFDEINHQYFIKTDSGLVLVPSVTQILSHFGIVDFSRINEDVLENACNFGTAVHEVCKLYDLNKLNDYKWDEEKLTPYLDQYKKFLEEVNPKWDIIENPLYYKAFNFCGTPDRAGIIKKKYCVLDIKTGVEKPADSLQLAAYKALIEDNYKERLKDNMSRYTLHISSDKYRLVKHDNSADKRIFLYLADAYDWKVKHKLI